MTLPGEPTALLTGARVTVSVPATSANLGPGFDCFGLALDWRDTVEVEVCPAGTTIEITGEGADTVRRDSDHLVARAVRRSLSDAGAKAPGLRIRSHNLIPHGRGLGSSSAAIVSGLVAGSALAGVPLDRQALLRVATELEGHPDNVAAAIFGGFVLAWMDADGARAVTPAVSDGLRGLVFVPEAPLATAVARGLLPVTVPLTDAAANLSRSALLVHALASAPELILSATEDRLHQSYRSAAMPESARLVESLRSKGIAAMISGAGPTVLVLSEEAAIDAAEGVSHSGFTSRRVRVGSGVRVRDPR